MLQKKISLCLGWLQNSGQMSGLRGIEIKSSWVDYCNNDPSCGYPHAPLTKPFVTKTGISNLDFETIILMPSFIDWIKRERNRLAYEDRQIFSFSVFITNSGIKPPVLYTYR